MTSVREAAERLRACGSNLGNGQIADRNLIVHAYLSEHPSDENDQLTDEALRRFGFTKALNGPTRWYSDWLTLKPAVNGAWAAWHYLDDSDRQPCLVVLLTVGDLRRLAIALGLELQEAGNGEA